MMLQSHWGSLYRCMDGDFVAFLDSYGGDFTRRFQKWWFNNLRSFGDSYPKNCVALSLAAPNNEWDFTKAKLCCTLASTALPFIWWRCMQKNIKSRSVIHNRNKSRTIEIKIHSMSAANTTYKSFTIQDQRCQKKMRISAVQKRAEKGALGPSNLQGKADSGKKHWKVWVESGSTWLGQQGRLKQGERWKKGRLSEVFIIVDLAKFGWYAPLISEFFSVTAMRHFCTPKLSWSQKKCIQIRVTNKNRYFKLGKYVY